MPVGFHGKFCTDIDGKRHTWFIQSLVKHTADLAVRDIPMSELEHFLDVNCWFDAERLPTPRAMAEHWKRMQDADLTYPIILSKEHGLMDGMHRLMKAHVSGYATIRAVVLEETPPPDEIS